MLVAKAWDVELDLADYEGKGPRTFTRPGYAMLHDETGKWWPSNSALWMPFDRAPVDVPPSKDAERYIGPEVKVTRGLELPPKDLLAWIDLGEIIHVWYRRRGTHKGTWHHPFGEKKLLLIFTRKKPMLYRFGTDYRVELRGASWTWRGFQN